MAPLFTVQNAKTIKGEKKGYRTFLIYLASAKISGYQVCASSSEGCRIACLYSAGMGVFTNVQTSRVAKTVRYFTDRPAFLADMVKGIQSAVKSAARADMVAVFRLNGTSDIRFEHVPVMLGGVEYANVFEAFPYVTFYDYTKHANRVSSYANYSLTLSRSETNEAACMSRLANGGNVAVVFSGALPETWNGYTVVCGDTDDLRFLDPAGVVVGLRAKGKAKKDTSGFVVPS
jgi:hypothetical protein